MNNGSLTRLLLYVGIAGLTQFGEELSGIKQFADKTALEWAVSVISSTLAALIVWRAYIDQHISKASPPEVKP